MAVIAANLGMLTHQGEIRLLVVVEAAFQPLLARMTIATGVTHFTPVGVLRSMAVLAVAGSFFVTIARMA